MQNNHKEQDMALKFLSAREYAVRLKTAIHATGKYGFAETTANALELTKDSYVAFAKDEETGTLYFINNAESTPDSFKVMKNGDYFSVNTKALFDALGYDYESNIITFDLIRDNSLLDIEAYKMLKKETPRKQKKEKQSKLT